MAWLDLEEELAEEFGELTQLDDRDSDGLTVILPTQSKDERLDAGLCVECGRASGGTRRCSFCAAKARRHQRAYVARTYEPKARRGPMPAEERARRHRERNVAYMRAKYVVAVTTAATCVRCSRAHEPGRRQCVVCLENMRLVKAQKARQTVRVSPRVLVRAVRPTATMSIVAKAHQSRDPSACDRCNRTRVEGKKHCAKCLEYFASRDLSLVAKAADGLCRRCGVAHTSGKRNCERCLEMVRVAWRLRKGGGVNVAKSRRAA